MAQRVKLYEEKKSAKALPLWAWVLAIVLMVALIVFFFTRHNDQALKAPTITPAAAVVGGMVEAPNPAARFSAAHGSMAPRAA